MDCFFLKVKIFLPTPMVARNALGSNLCILSAAHGTIKKPRCTRYHAINWIVCRADYILGLFGSVRANARSRALFDVTESSSVLVTMRVWEPRSVLTGI